MDRFLKFDAKLELPSFNVTFLLRSNYFQCVFMLFYFNLFGLSIFTAYCF